VTVQRVFGRLVLGLGALLLMAAGSLLLSGYGGLTDVEVAGATPFPLPEAQHRWTDVVFRDGGLPGRRDVRIVVEDQVTADLRLTLPGTDPLVRQVGSGQARRDSWNLAFWAMAHVELQSGTGRAFLEWEAPTVERTRGGEATILLSGRTPEGLSGPFTVRVQSRSACRAVRCPVSVSLTAPGRAITAVSPQRYVERQSGSALSATIRLEQLVVRVDDEQAADGRVPVVLVPGGVGQWAAAAWRPLWVLVPWLLLVWWTAGADPPGTPRRLRLDTYRTAMVSLLAAGALAIFGLSIGHLDEVYRALEDQLRGSRAAGVGARLLPQLPSFGASTVSAVAAAFAIWAFRAREGLPASPRTTSVVLHGTALALGAAVVVAVATASTGSPFISDVAGRGLWLGLALTVVGCLLLSVALRPSRGAVAAGLSGSALLGAIAFTDATSGALAAWVAGVLAMLCAGAFVVTLAWTAVAGSGSHWADRLRARRLVRVGAVLAALLVVTPTQRWYAALAPLAPYDVVSVAFSTSTLVRFALVVTAAGLLWALSRRPNVPPGLVRLLAIGAMLALLLRADVLYRGIPLSFLVGALLTVTVLVVPAAAAASWPLTPPPGRGGAAQISSLLTASARSRFDRDLRASLRRKVASADLDPKNASAIQQAVTTAFGPRPAAPPAALRRDALGWAGTPDPWLRGLIAALAAAVMGAFLAAPTLGATVSDLTSLRGPEPWSILLTALLTFRYPIYGFLFGYFLPVLRGSTGLGKAGRLFVVLVVSEACVLLLPFAGAEQFLQAVTLRALQLAMLGGVLGVGADLLALRTVGAGPGDLLDLYHTNRLVLWSSGIAVAAATAAATALVGSAATLLVDRILPDEAPPPPPANVASDTPAPGR
jgi:hypothetical protein